MKQSLALLLGCMVLGSSWCLGADEAPAQGIPPEAEDPIIAEARQAAAEAASREAEAPDGGSLVDDNPGASEETFTPTVQISEDLSVSFPVDI